MKQETKVIDTNYRGKKILENITESGKFDYMKSMMENKFPNMKFGPIIPHQFASDDKWHKTIELYFDDTQGNRSVGFLDLGTKNSLNDDIWKNRHWISARMLQNAITRYSDNYEYNGLEKDFAEQLSEFTTKLLEDIENGTVSVPFLQ